MACQEEQVEKRIGMLAGWGNYPVRVAQALKDAGYSVYCLGVKGHCKSEAELRDICTDFAWTTLGKFGKSIRYFQSHSVPDCIMLGKIHKKELFKPWALFALLPDWVTIKTFAAFFLFKKKDCRDDSLLKRIVDLYAQNGIRMGVPTDYCPALLVKEDCLTKRQPTEQDWKDIEYGWQVAKDMGRFDVGQTVIVKNQMAVAIEAIEGTDACIKRAGDLSQRGGLVMVKVAKPQQDMRFDVPTIGMTTVKNLVAAGGKVLAVEANKTILIDEDAVVDYANAHNLVIVAIKNVEQITGVSQTDA
ncbi:MAG: UDP-2,3-diacylglucosamine diphosphatase LpxI [Thermoguttaceae bacterium]|nr:UDP-2,3-diacylglucosamine diphosphatase LpxI [Thermoguttaceae bacterium]